MDLSFIDKKIDELIIRKITASKELVAAELFCDNETIEKCKTNVGALTSEIVELRKQKDDLIERHYRVQCEIYREYPTDDE